MQAPRHRLALAGGHERPVVPFVLGGHLDPEHREDGVVEALGGLAVRDPDGDVVEHGATMPEGRRR